MYSKSVMVSCVIPTYKRNNTLKRAIESIFNQTYASYEILVVDDNEDGDNNSSNIWNCINAYRDTRIRYIRHGHKNGAEARNEGIRQARGEYVAFWDDDDEWLPEKLEKQVEILNCHQEYQGVTCLYDEYKKGVKYHSCPPYNGENLGKKVFERSVVVYTSTLLMRKKPLIDIGLFNTKLERHQELQLLIEFLAKYDVFVISDYLVKKHTDSSINRPTYEEFCTVKEVFFNAVGKQLLIYSERDRKVIVSAHRFELAFSAFKERKFLSAIKEVICVGINIDAYRLLLKRYRDRKYII